MNNESNADEVSVPVQEYAVNSNSTPMDIIKAAPVPEITNKPHDILSAWTAIEVLSPQTFDKPEKLANGNKELISNVRQGLWAWETCTENSSPTKNLFYQVVLGTIDMKPTIDALLNVYHDTRAERQTAKGEAVLATIMVDKTGCPADINAISISSFAWGVPVALKGKLHDLSVWTQAEDELKVGLAQFININLDDNKVKAPPLTSAIIKEAYEWLVKKLELNASLIKPPVFAIKIEQNKSIETPPSSVLLNSFFLDDLNTAKSLITTGKAPPNLRRYLGMDKPSVRYNLLTDRHALAESMQPKQFPLSSWPAFGRHPLVMLQQCAVNLATDFGEHGMLAVNGPPGTGKTTLLRDIVASVITDRADAMASYDDPQEAFAQIGEVKRGQAKTYLYKLDEKLRGYEIIVASSNNKAVENVSAELPALDAIAKDAHTLRYFKTASDNMLGRESWGAIAAVLGNSKNRNTFTNSFWWDKDFGMQKYLQHASGTPQLIPDIEKGEGNRQPRVIENEDPPSGHEDALDRWKEARNHYKKTKKTVQHSMHELQIVYELQIQIEKDLEQLEGLSDVLESQEESRDALIERGGTLESLLKAKTGELSIRQEYYDASNGMRPWFLSRWLRTVTFRGWVKNHEIVKTAFNQARLALALDQKALDVLKTQYAALEGEIKKLNLNISHLEVINKTKNEQIADALEHHDGLHINRAFFKKAHRDKQMAVPWVGDVIARQRHDLFAASMALHKAFVDAAAKPIRHNMNLFVEDFGMRSIGNSAFDEVIPHLWSTMSLLVPVVSTTFASVGRMFKNIKAEELGWLLIDEAGQSLPQAAVGALMRTRKAVIVGDPIQIEPVVTLPNTLTEAICRQFGVDAMYFNAPTASAQTLADDASTYYAAFETKNGTRTVGVPLLVHRRCSAPMFEISNATAYENMMVQAKSAQDSAILNVLGESRWIHVEGMSSDKWCNEEGQMVLQLLQKIKSAGCPPSLFIVSPFAVVEDKLRRLIYDSRILEGWVDNPSKWPYQRVGTVHTVQGREDEAVIFVLGAPNLEQQGARRWAGGSPNLLNVAITRSKEALYVIGNKDLWKTAGHFQTLATMLP